MRDPAASVAHMSALRAMGVSLAIDDFGTGYSSLSYLRRLPADVLKIDRSFVQDLGGAETSLRLIRGILALAHGLGMHVTAEGVEKVEQLNILRQLCCDVAQGFLLSRPLTARDATAFLAAANTTVVPEFAGQEHLNSPAGSEAAA